MVSCSNLMVNYTKNTCDKLEYVFQWNDYYMEPRLKITKINKICAMLHFPR
jgi:hypothetical protein